MTLKKSIPIAFGIAAAVFCFAFLTGFSKPEVQTFHTAAKNPIKQSDVSEQSDFKWHNMSEGYEKAIREKKMLLVDVYTDWCGWCKVMDAKTYSDASVIQKINAHYVAVKFNPEISAEHVLGNDTLSSSQLLTYLNRGRRMPGYPMTYIWPVPSNQSSIAPYSGYIEADPFSNMLSEYISKYLD